MEKRTFATVRVDENLMMDLKIALAKRRETMQQALHRAIVDYIRETNQLETEGHLHP